MTTATLTHEEAFSQAIDRKSLELYPKSNWETSRKNYDSLGLDIEYYDMQCATFDALYEEDPALFDGFQWINSEDGMPLWVRPGIDWIPDHELEDDYDYFG